MEALPFAIIRVEKVRSLGSLRGLGAHHTRAAPTPNADPSAPPPVALAGSGHPYRDVKALLPAKRRKNAVLAMEHLVTASPEYFRPDNPGAHGQYDQARMEAWRDRAMAFLRARYGDRLASATLHLDEATPHIQAFVVPLREDGKLDAATLFNPAALVRLQDDYAAALAPLGLRRGIEGSKAKHESIKSFYARTKAPATDLPAVTTPRPEPMPDPSLAQRVPGSSAKKAYEAEAQRRADQAKRRNAEVAKRQRAIERVLPELEAKAEAFDLRRKADSSRRRLVEQMRAEAARVREIPLGQVLERLGCERDPADPKRNWKTPAGRITVTGAKFFNHDTGQGGGGAIDLVMQQLGCDYTAAVAWLGGQVGAEAAVGAAMAAAKEAAQAAVTQAKPPAPVPEPSDKPEHVERVRSYLVERRRILPRLVDWLIKRGQVFAAAWPGPKGGTLVNAAFRLDSGGVELRGTGGDFHGVRGAKGGFVLSSNNAARTVLVESAIEAMSYATLAIERGEPVRVVSTTGSSTERLLELVAAELAAGRQVVAGFNADKAGQALAAKVMAAGGSAVEAPPMGCKDWNEYLVVRGSAEASEATKEAENGTQQRGHHAPQARRP